MKPLKNHIQNELDEGLKEIFSKSAQFRPSDPNHRRLMNSFVAWLNGMREKYDDSLILNMLHSVEEDISLGEI